MVQQLNLFEQRSQEKLKEHAPLAERMRPVAIDEFVGQTHLLGEGKILHRLLRSGKLQSLILWGPPGCGKTTLAGIIAKQTQTHLISLSAVTAGTREIRAAVEEALAVWVREKKHTLLFMDEIHRLNKAQQDTLLPHVENGTLFLLGATTENPSFEIIRPLLSRAQVLVLEPLKEKDLKSLIQRSLQDTVKGLGKFSATLTKEAEDYLLAASGGDARIVLNALETAVSTTAPTEANSGRVIDLQTMQESLLRKAIHYDKGGEEHFNLISALHKSIRGSDPDAGLYWLARMLDAGEDPIYIARRLVRMASEDIGLADPMALVEAVAALQSYQLLGTPEGELALAQVVVYLALSPKSNTIYEAFGKAMEMARKTGTYPVPLHIRNAPTTLLKELGYGREYRYPHDDPSGWIEETYLPENLTGTLFYHPTQRGWEGKWRQLLARRRQLLEKRSKFQPRNI
ncbi:replication-associated recombination protein A [Desulforhabdus amnigena]|jgi:putative ATPase|uniref:Replication-associated recombination protein A n=1 Tax=Desulforhabdus amnigena TaxID=40218 RepID=A0A9W6D1Q3_9BACT|nr:replication-associated recombination protein A [Desulforhabdus amnigena]NLJ28365.1 replication-associated recombination protein A [Deltaproteobacteria bacterium]GLI33354.1 ATPase AAA [Desulforhabdus amnigena]